MHFKHFWVPCLHIIFFTSRLECSRKLNEKMKWNSGIPAGIPAAAGIPVRWHPLSDFKTVDSNKRGSRFPLMWLESLQSLEGLLWAPLDSNEEKLLSDVTGIHWSKMRAFRIKCRVSERSQVIKISFFYAAAPQNSCRKYFLYVIGFEFVEKYSYQTN
jgi:hypothetical protein